MNIAARATLLVPALSVVVAATAGCGGGGGAAAEETSTPVAVVAATPLIVGGSQANYGSTALAGGFLPDPFQVEIVSGPIAAAGNSVDIASLGLPTRNSGTCTGFTTSQPDFVVHVSNPGQLLRFFMNAPGDTTLIINDAAGGWWCSDDDGGNYNPLIDIANPPAGQYDIWVGSYQAGANIQGVLSVSELTSVHP